MCCLAEPGGGGEAWYSFNDDAVARVKPEQVVSQYAYILCYARRRQRDAGGGQHSRPPSAGGGQHSRQPSAGGGQHSRQPSAGGAEHPAGGAGEATE